MNIDLMAKAFTTLLSSNDKYLELYISEEWDEFKLDRKGDLTEWLTQNHPHKYHRKWNKHVAIIKPEVEYFVSNLKEIVKSNEFDRCVDTLSWDLLHIRLEEFYGNLKGAPLFYLHILKPEYENGSIPYGWDGQFPEGRIKAIKAT